MRVRAVSDGTDPTADPVIDTRPVRTAKLRRTRKFRSRTRTTE